MSKPDNWMPLYIGDYLRDTSRLTTEGHGAYLLLIMDYWISGPLPDDDNSLAAICKLAVPRWRKLKLSVTAFFSLSDGRWHHKRIDAERAKASEVTAKRKQAGREGADRRWQKHGQANADAIANAIAEPLAKASPGQWQNDAPSPSPLQNNNELGISSESMQDPSTVGRLAAAALQGLGLAEPDPSKPIEVQVIQAFDRERVLAFGEAQGRPYPAPNDRMDAKRYLAAGADLATCRAVFETICQRNAAQALQPPNNLKYFQQAIANALATGNQPLPAGTAIVKTFDPDQYLAAKDAEAKEANHDAA